MALLFCGCGESAQENDPLKASTPRRVVKDTPDSAPPTLEDRLRAANFKVGFEWASVHVDGEQIVVSGIAPDEQSVKDFRVALRAAAIVDPARFESLVREEFKVSLEYTLSLRREGQILSGSGTVPDLESRNRLEAQARSFFRGVNLRPISPVKGAATPHFHRSADIAVSALAMFEYGTAELESDTLVFAGAVDPSKREALDALLAKVPQSYLVSSEAVVDAQEVRDCLAETREALAAQRIEFTGAKLRAGLRLDALVLALAGCPAPIAIQMHTDNVGPLAQRRERGKARAAALEAALRAAGANEHKARVVDLGANFPVGDNGTAAGRAQNNRVSADFLTAAP